MNNKGDVLNIFDCSLHFGRELDEFGRRLKFLIQIRTIFEHIVANFLKRSKSILVSKTQFVNNIFINYS
ncbi:hypothetical protein PMAYCL1PPCAC_25435, partial [Pristionchus mayeri]